ncbi:hypothetical protein GGF43_002193 [Coemansia sp. RSA 2618]|nr:hypothetical protein GGF43_002193 [Coemansia sp. RSA 2618]
MSGAVHNVGSETNARIKERKAVAQYILEERLWQDIDNVLLLAKPQSPADDAVAARIAKDIHDRLENLLMGDYEEVNLEKMLSMDPGLRRKLDKAAEIGDEETLASIIKLWTDKAFSRESEMYPLFSAFVLFVQLRIKASISDTPSESGTPPESQGVQTRRMARAAKTTKHRSVVARLLLPYVGADFKPHGIDEDEKIDNALRLCDADDPVQPHDADRKARHMFGVVEAKYSKNDTDNAFKQIIEYSRVLYRTQYDRRFTWALSVCGSEVRACILIHDAVFASHAMDIGSSSGRLQLIQLLVNWCVCDKQQLGYDPTMRYDEAKRSYEIDCVDDKKPRTLRTYVTDGFLVAADSVLGRHTRCFRAHLADGNAVVIKDAWAVASAPPLKDPRSEITLMRAIEKGLAGKDCDFKYPQLVSGGHVRVEQHGKSVIDSTDAIFALLGAKRTEPEAEPDEPADRSTAKEKAPWTAQPLRAHRRIVMAPLGQHLKSVTAQHDLILVLAEAMRCHSGILKHCNVLHRDISMDNILVVPSDDDPSTGKKQPPHGLLIDFDYAISIGKDRKGSRAERSGTRPYMSIHNLENADCERTALDDWESLLYMVCWLGTIGLTKDERDRAHHTVPGLPINTWNLGSVQDNARAKQANARIKEREAEAEYVLEERLWQDIDNVLLLAKPQSPADDAEAVRITKDIHDRLEDLLRVECAAFDMKSMLSMDPGLRTTLGDAEADVGEEMLALIIKLWTDKAFSRESEMYPLFSAFVLFVQLRIKADMPIRTGMQTRRMARAAKTTKPRSVVARLLLPYVGADFKPHGIDEDEKIDNALRLCDTDDPVQPYDADRKARHMFGVVEAKYSKNDTDIAFKQIIEYSRVLYRTQYDRRFTWALSVCGSEVRACILLHDAVFASRAMDIGSPSGRLQFIQLLVNLCICDKQQLGYDPTIRHSVTKGRYEIDCFDDDNPARPQAYVMDGVLIADDSVLGRRTRCFLAHLDDGKAVVIKDAWAVASTSPMEDPRSEITLLRTIKKGLQGKKRDYMYPEIVRGGHVRVEQHGKSVIDSTDAIFALLEVDRMEPENGPEERATAKEKGPWVTQPLRAHRRIVMAPVGQQLDSVTEEHDLILVLAEAMRCHSGIRKHCGILHRDISMGNILVVPSDDDPTTGGKRPPSGLLIDFDYAISVGQNRKRSRAERSGTLPYMSIHNLENADCERTALDDWESLLYMPALEQISKHTLPSS